MGLDGADKLLLGFETSDDAAVYQIDEHTAAVLTVDFLTPLVDDPYDFGRLAAANALSDVFAMGAKPVCALNVLALDCALGTEVAAEIMRGGASAVREAGCFMVGGHSVDDPEPKYGLCVFGVVDPAKVKRNGGAQVGDALYLTKRLGTGLLSAAYKIGRITEEEFRPAIDSMCQLNKAGGAAATQANAHAVTDVTGFGLAGHLHEMLEASGCSMCLNWERLPLFSQAWDLSVEYCRPNRTFSIMDFAEPFVEQGTLDGEEFDNRMGVLCDPQTSGGLLVAVAPEDAPAFEAAFANEAGFAPWRIGTFVEGAGCTIRFADAG